MSNDGKTSPWVWVGLGCLGAVLVAVLAVVGLGMYAARKAQQFGEEMKDPAAREAKVKAALGASQLPQGYEPVVAMKIPFLIEMAVLADHAPKEGEQVEVDLSESGRPKHGGEGEYGFILLRVLLGGADDEQELRAFLQGEGPPPKMFEHSDININADQVIERGSVAVGGLELPYLLQSGEIQVSEDRHQGELAVVQWDCPGDDKPTLGIWFGPRQEERQDIPAGVMLPSKDTAELQRFLGHFDICANRG